MEGLPPVYFHKSLGLRRLGVLGEDVAPRRVAAEAARAAWEGLREAERELPEPAGLARVYIEEWELRAWLLPDAAVAIAPPGEAPRGLVIVEPLAASRLHAEEDIETCREAGARILRGEPGDLEALVEELLTPEAGEREEPERPAQATREALEREGPEEAAPEPTSRGAVIECGEEECRRLMAGCLNLYARLIRQGTAPSGIEGRRSGGLVVLARGGEYACAASAGALPHGLPPGLEGCPYIMVVVRRSGAEARCLRDLGEVIEALEALEEEGFTQAPE